MWYLFIFNLYLFMHSRNYTFFSINENGSFAITAPGRCHSNVLIIGLIFLMHHLLDMLPHLSLVDCYSHIGSYHFSRCPRVGQPAVLVAPFQNMILEFNRPHPTGSWFGILWQSRLIQLQFHFQHFVDKQQAMCLLKYCLAKWFSGWFCYWYRY